MRHAHTVHPRDTPSYAFRVSITVPGRLYGGGTLHVSPGALVVVPPEVVNAVGGDEASDAGVGSVVIVEVEPVGVGGCACLV